MKTYTFDIELYKTEKVEARKETYTIEAETIEEAQAKADEMATQIPFGTEDQPIYNRTDVKEKIKEDNDDEIDPDDVDTGLDEENEHGFDWTLGD